MTLEALSLLDVILERPCRPILHSLCLASVSGRGYFNSGAAEAAIDSWSDEEDERERNRTGEIAEVGFRASVVSAAAVASAAMFVTVSCC